MEAELINHGATAGLGGGGFWLLWRMRQVEMKCARLEVESEHQKAELEKGSEKFDRIEEKLDGIRSEIHDLALAVKQRNGGTKS